MNSGPTLQIGSTGPDVRRLQILFVMTKLLDYTGIDGDFGQQTQDAVKSFQRSSNLTADGGGRTSNVERPSSGSEHTEVSPRVNGKCCIRTAKSAGNIRRCKHSNRSWAYRWGLWSKDRNGRARVSNGPRRYSRWSRWRSDVVGSGRRSRQNVGVIG